MNKGFSSETLPKGKRIPNLNKKELNGRLISWSPWPPENFKTRYPAFPFVLTILILITGKCILSLY